MSEKKTLSVLDAVALIIGIVVGVGIFKAPSIVAANAEGTTAFFLAWVAGGAVSLVGALCYAELAAAYPHAGGEYHYLGRAFGPSLAFLFAWSRMTVIQTGSIAMLAFVLGDYLAQMVPVGPHASPIFAASAVVVLTGVNMAGLAAGRRAQNILTAVKVAGLLFVIVAGLLWAGQPGAPAQPRPGASPAFGLAMIFVLLTYGGWNEAVYISSELRDVERNILRALVWGIGVITAIYLLLNLAYWRVLGLAGMNSADAVASTMAARVLGPRGAALIDLLVCISALGATNASIITGARTNLALGRDFRHLARIGAWNETRAAPTNALVVQGVITLLLIALGATTRNGFVTTVEYTAPVFWLFFLLTTVALVVLRQRDPSRARPVRVPLYPVTPCIFSLVCLWMFVASVRYTGAGALAGLAVLVAGFPLLFLHRGAGEKRRR